MSGPNLKAQNLTIDLPLVRHGRGHGGLSLTSMFTNIGQRKKENRRVLSGVTLHLKEGDRIGLSGRNGSGKTTLLKALAGIYSPTKGWRTHEGRLLCVLNPQFGLQQEASGFENILLRGLHLDLSMADMRKRADEIIDFAELSESINDPLYTYSAGMRARLALSILLHSDPDILLLDEWLGAGDRQFQKKAADRLREFVRSARILVVATHNPRLLNALCNRVLTLERGEVISDEKTSVGSKNSDN